MFFYDQINEATEDDVEAELTLRINCEGGSPDYGMSIIEKVQELSGQMYVKVGAQAHSMGLFILAYLDKNRVECIDTTQAVLHRAAYPDYIEKSPSFAGSVYEDMMVKTNKDLEKAFRAAVDVEALESLPQFTSKNITLKDIFSTESRIEVLLTSSDLKKIGLVSKVNKITPTRQAAMMAQAAAFKKCTSLNDFKLAAQSAIMEEKQTVNNNIMTLAELREKHPSIYAEAIQAGVNQEKERIEGIMVFADVDLPGCKAAIESGKPLTAKQSNEFMLKSFSAQALKGLEKDSTTDSLVTDEIPVGEKGKKEKELEAFEASVQAKLKLTK